MTNNYENDDLKFVYLKYTDFLKKTKAEIIANSYLPRVYAHMEDDDPGTMDKRHINKLQDRTKSWLYSIAEQRATDPGLKRFYKKEMARCYHPDSWYEDYWNWLDGIDVKTKNFGFTGRTETIQTEDGPRECEVWTDAKVPHLMWMDSEGRPRVQE